VANDESAPTTDKGMDVSRQMTREQWQAFAMAHLAKDPRVKEVQHRLRDYTRQQRQAQKQSKDKQNQEK
jgi:competence protein ComGC